MDTRRTVGAGLGAAASTLVKLPGSQRRFARRLIAPDRPTVVNGRSSGLSVKSATGAPAVRPATLPLHGLDGRRHG